MPLSEQEQRLLDEMERHLMSNDADVVTAPSRALSYRNIVLGSILVLAGLGALIAGVSIGFNTGVLGLGVGSVGSSRRGGGSLSPPPRPSTSRVLPSAGAAQTRGAARGWGDSFRDGMTARGDRRNDGH